MIDIPEERILKEITDILMNDLPKVLLELEEQSEDSIRLPPFRYVGVIEKMPKGTSIPYALLEIEECTYSDKDRILKNVIYSVQMTLIIIYQNDKWRYFNGISTCLLQNQEMKNKYSIRKEKVNTNKLTFSVKY